MLNCSKTRAYCFTINNYDHFDLADTWQLYDKYGQYMITGFETGEEGTPHIQGYIYCKNPQYFTTISNILVRAHITKANGNPLSNFDYCRKEGQYVEYGELPVKGRMKWADIENAMRDPKNNIHAYNQYRKAYIDIKSRERPANKPRKIYRWPRADRFSLMYHLDEKEMSFALSDTWDGEQVCIVDNEGGLPTGIEDKHLYWSHGYPQKIRYGYQFMLFDPDIVIYLVDLEDKFIPKDLKSLPEYSIEQNASQDVLQEETPDETDI